RRRLYTMSLHDALPILRLDAGAELRPGSGPCPRIVLGSGYRKDRRQCGLLSTPVALRSRGKKTDHRDLRGSVAECPVQWHSLSRSEEHTSELQSRENLV